MKALARINKKIKQWNAKIEEKVNNYRLKTKLYLLFAFCVVFPIIVTDSVVIYMVVKAEHNATETEMKNVANAVEYTVNATIENAKYLSKDICVNKVIAEFVETQYKSPSDYFSNYLRIKENNSLYVSLGSNRAEITIYSDNETLINGSEFGTISSIRDSYWYRNFKSAKDKTIIFPYTEYVRSGFKPVPDKKKLSIIRQMDIYPYQNMEKILKIDFDYSGLINSLINANYNEEVYVCQGDQIILSNQEEIKWSTEYKTFGNELKSQVGYKKTIPILSENWIIYVLKPEQNIEIMLKNNLYLLILLILISFVLPILLMSGISRSFTQRLRRLSGYFSSVQEESLEEITDNSGMDEIGILMQDYNRMVKRMNTLIQTVYKERMKEQQMDIARQKAELAALHSQINPHFMFNALESIRMRSVLKKEDETADMIGKLAIMMRKCLDWGVDSIPVKDEMEFVEAYLNLQRYRFGNRLSYHLEIDKFCEYLSIPKLTIVTFVENACVHGIEGMVNEGWIFVNIAVQKENLVIEIEDTGVGMSEEFLKQLNQKIANASVEQFKQGKCIGIINACLRLNLYGNGRIKIAIESEKEIGTSVTITIPLEFARTIRN